MSLIDALPDGMAGESFTAVRRTISNVKKEQHPGRVVEPLGQ